MFKPGKQGGSHDQSIYLMLPFPPPTRTSQAPFIWSQAPETTLPPSYCIQAKVTFSFFLCNINQSFTLELRTCLGG